MKSLRTLSMLLLIGLLLSAGTAVAYDRVVLWEGFTSTTCGACASSHAQIGGLYDDYDPSQVTFINYHMSWPAPGNDPWYLRNTSHNDGRRGYYSVNAIPHIELDGETVELNDLFNVGAMSANVNARLSVDTPILIEVEPDFDGDQVIATVTVTSDEDITDNLRLYTALAETHVTWSSPAPNGMTSFHYPMLHMSPSHTGQAYTAEAGQSQEFEITFPFDDQFSPVNLTVIAFVQSVTSDEVYQSASAEVPANAPNLRYVEHTWDDAGQAHPNERPDAGETADIYITLENLMEFLPATSVSGGLTSDNPDLGITENLATWPDMQPGESASNDVPFGVSVPDDFEPQMVTFMLSVTADGGYERIIEFEAMVGVPEILLYNDYEQAVNYGHFWTGIFEEMGVLPDVMESNTLETDYLDQYRVVVWATGSSDIPGFVISDTEQDAFQAYVENGGRLILSSQYAANTTGTDTFFEEVFGVEHGLSQVPGNQNYLCEGFPTSPFPDAYFLLVGAGGAGNSTSPSSMVPLDGTVPFYHYYNSQEVAAAGYDHGDGGRTVYAGFALEAISGQQNTDTAADVLAGMIDWVDGLNDIPDNGTGEPALPSNVELTAYPNPFNPDLTVGYALPSAGQATVAVYDLLGRRVATLVQGRQTAGLHRVTWQAGDAASGVYIVRMHSPMGRVSKRVTLVK